MLTVEEARAFAHDEESSDADIEDFIRVAESLIEDGIGEEFDRTDAKAKMLARLYVADLTDNRMISAAENNTRRDMIASLIMQLRAKTMGGDSG